MLVTRVVAAFVVMIAVGSAGCQPRACAVEPKNCAAQCDEGRDDEACARSIEYQARGVAGYRHDPTAASARAVSLCSTGRFPKTCLTYMHLVANGLVVRDATAERTALSGACAATSKPEGAPPAYAEACDAYFDRQLSEAARGDSNGSTRRRLVAELEQRCFEANETRRCLTLADVRGGAWGESLIRKEDAVKALRWACDRGTALACERLELSLAAMERERAIEKQESPKQP